MEAKYAQLNRILEEEVLLYNEFLRLSREKTEAILTGDTTTLSAITRNEQAMIYTAGQLEKQQDACVQDIKEAAGSTETRWNLTNLMDLAPGKERENLSKHQETLGRTLVEQQELNELNGKLLQSNLEYIHSMLARMHGNPVTYDTTGSNVSAPERNRLLDKRI